VIRRAGTLAEEEDMPSNRSRRIAAAVLSLATTLALAQDPADELVVTATREAQRLGQTIQNTSVITQREIRASQAVDLPTLLRREAGVEFTQNGGVGRVGSLFVRGANSNATLVLIDGVRVQSATTGTTQVDQLLLDQIERVEIVRGPGSALYGADALGGVIQIFTKRGRGAPQPRVLLGGGNERTGRFDAGYGGEVGDTRFDASVSGFTTNGFSALRPAASPTANPDDDGYRNLSGSASVRHYFGERFKAGLSWFGTEGKSEFDNAFAANRAERHEGRAYVAAATGFAEGRFTDFWTSRVTLSQGIDRFRNYVNDRQTSSFRTENDQATWQNELALAPGHNLILGADWLSQRIATTTAYSRDSRHVNSLFAGYTGQVGRSAFQVNARVDDYSDFGAKGSGLVGYGFQATDAVRLTALWGQAYRAPSFNELFFPGFGNPNLQPEQVTSTEVGAQYAAGPHLARVAGFYSTYKDLIGGFPITNVAEARVKGVELAYQGRILATSVRASLTLQDPENTATGQELIRRAKQFGSLVVGHRFGAFSVGAEMIASGPRYDNDVFTFQRVRLPGYAIFNLVGRYDLGRGMALGVRVDNLFDKDYTLVSGYNTQGTLALVTFSYTP
jgi:vitamin B12 transporter